MASARISDTGAELQPVELWINDVGSGVPARLSGAAAGSIDGVGGSLVSLWQYPLIYNGATWDRRRTPSKFVVVNLSAATAETTLWTPAAGRKFRVMGFTLTAGGACELSFKDGTGGTTVLFYAAGADPLTVDLRNGLLSTAANNLLTVVRSASVTLKGTIYGTEE
jgi:hypothetical protein